MNSKLQKKANGELSFIPEDMLNSGFPFRLHTITHDSTYSICDAHSHNNFYELVLVRSGSALHTREDSCVIVQSGDIFLLRPGEVHYYSEARDFSIYNICYTGSFMQEVPFSQTVIPQFYWEKDCEKKHLPHRSFFKALSLLEDVWEKQSPFSAENQTLILADIIELFTLIRRSGQDTEKHRFCGDARLRISLLTNLLSRKYMEKWDLERMAKETGYSVGCFRYYFKELVHCSPLDYLLSLRLDKAALMLCSTGENVSSITFACGFSDVSYFTRQFKKQFSSTPNQFRQDYKKHSGDARKIALNWSGVAKMSANVFFPPGKISRKDSGKQKNIS